MPARKPFSEPAFHAAQRKRLAGKELSRGFEGTWGKRLVLQLKRLLPDRMSEPEPGAAEVADCFAQALDGELPRLFHALKESLKASSALNADELSCFMEFMAYGTVRCLDLHYWQQQECWEDDRSGRFGRVDRLHTRSAAMATIGLAALDGVFVRPVLDANRPGVVDLSQILATADYVEAVQKHLYDTLLKATHPRRVDPEASLTLDQIAELELWFEERRFNAEACTVFLYLPHADANMQLDIAQQVARTLNAGVALGSADDDPRVVRHEQTGITAANLAVRVRELLDMVTQPLAANAGSGASARTSPAATAASAPLFEYDVFISHAREDKPDFVEPLVAELKRLSIKVWYDADQLSWGDDVPQAINRGLSKSRFVVVVLSEVFLSKRWPQNELSAAFSAQTQDGRKRVLPLLLDRTYDHLVGDWQLLSSSYCLEFQRSDPQAIQRTGQAVREQVSKTFH